MRIGPALLLSAGVLLLSCGTHPSTRAEVSYGRQIARVFALYCTGCHSQENPSSSFYTGSYSGLRQGGTIGEDIVPGSPDASILVQLLEGARGPEQQMPSNARPLAPSQIKLIRRWIEQEAADDHASTTCYRLTARATFPESPTPLRIAFLIPSAGVVELLLKDPASQSLLFRREASIKPLPESMDAGVASEWITWDIGRERKWTQAVDLELLLRYTDDRPDGASLRVGNAGNPAAVITRLQESTCMSR
jgi:mono/diheme cytochrome c family protein